MSNKFGAADVDATTEMNGKFLLEFDGTALAAFTKLTLGRSEWGKFPDRTGADNLSTKESSGLLKPTTIKLEKDLKVGGATDIIELFNWHQQGSLEKRSGAVILHDRTGVELMRWTFTDAWISAIDDLELDATAENAPVKFSVELSVSETVAS